MSIETEALESRQLLSGSSVDLSGLTAVPAITSAASSANITGLTPSQVAKAYNFTSTSGAALGTGQTIAIVDAYNDPNVASDLAAFSTQFGLPAAQLTVVNQTGGTALPAADAGWAEEIALDVEWAHAAAPGAKILLVEASSANLNDLITAVTTAAKSAHVVSMSWGGSEFFGENQLDSVFNVPGVTFVASAGDTPGVSWPAVSPSVVGVGGTTLSLSRSGGYGSESIWSSTGGGWSQFEPEPSYQATYSGLLGVGARVTPDVGYNANPSTGVAVLDTYQNPYSASGWFQVGGTSAGAPQWAAIFAAANSRRPAGSPLSSASALATLYSVANNPTTAANDLHMVTAGGAYFINTTTGVKFSLGAGLGTPNAANVIAALAGAATGTTGGGGSTGGGSTGGGSTGGGGGRHQRLSDPTTTVTVAPITAPALTLGGAFGAVINTATPATTAQAATAQSVSASAPSAAPSLPRPVQPVATTTPTLLSSGSGDQERAEEQAAAEAEVVPKDDTPAPAPRNEPASDETTPKNDKDAAPKTDEKTPADAEVALKSWDDVLAAFGDGASLAPVAVPIDPRALDDSESAAPSNREAAFAAGAALFAWGSWEVRTRLNDRRKRRSSLKITMP